MDANRMADLTHQIAFRLGMSPDELVEVLWPAINERIEREWVSQVTAFARGCAGPCFAVDIDGNKMEETERHLLT